MRVLRAAWRAWRAPADEVCVECLRPLDRRRQVWEVRESLADTPELGQFGGGTQVAASYCREHRPRGARRL